MALVIDLEKMNRFKQGSFESFVDRVEKLISESANLFSKNGRATVIATFPHHVILMTEEGEGFRASIKDSDDGLKIVSYDKIKELKALDEEDVSSLGVKYAREAVDLLFADKISEAKDRLDNCIRVGSKPFSKSSAMKTFLRESFNRVSGRNGFVGKYMAEHKYKMKKCVHGDVIAPDRVDACLLEGKTLDMSEIRSLCKKNIDLINSHVDDMTRTYVGKSIEPNKLMALKVIEESQDLADIAMKILSDSGELDEMREVYSKTSDYANSVELIKRYLEIA